ncbi:MAG: aspartate carbamoyltransferase catalytic subunit [Bdellovibrionales bacterium]|nr:aspartate carbamoyltransferase catalytic subunit [Bdellovibrionales bacterium]
MTRIPHLLGLEELSSAQIRGLLSVARRFADSPSLDRAPDLLQGKTVGLVFFEDSTRTKTSFETATTALGGRPMDFSAATSSLKKGETTYDTLITLKNAGADGFVVRHPSSGGPAYLAAKLGFPVVNAGDGHHEHPTQGLLDALTLEEALGSLKGRRVLIVGDIIHSRVARSNAHCLTKLGADVVLCGPPTLLPPEGALPGRVTPRLDEELASADAVMMLRIQFERQSFFPVPSSGEFTRFWGLTAERAALLKPEAFVMHPGPMNRGLEIDSLVADSPRSLIARQVAMGVPTRMACLAAVLAPDRLEQWAKKEGVVP